MHAADFFALTDHLIASGSAQPAHSYESPLAEYYDTIPQSEAELALNLRFAAAASDDVLELAVGTGRVAIPLALAGKRVVGLDLSEAMLQIGRRRAQESGVAERIQFVQGDMCQFALNRRFDLILIPNGSLIYLTTDEARLGLFRSVANHLNPGGRLVFSALAGEFVPQFGPFISHIHQDSATGALFTQLVGFRRLEPMVQEVRSLCTLTGPGQSRIWVSSSLEHAVTLPQVRALMQQAGLRLHAFYSDFDCSEYDPEAEDLIVVAGL